MPAVDIPAQGSEFNPEVAPAHSVRRATARRASNRRATARRRHGDAKTSIIDTLTQHSGSTAGDLAKCLNLNRGKVATRLTQLAKTGEITKDSHGYRTNHEARPTTRDDYGFKVGDRIVAESESTARRRRPGVIEEVLRSEPSPRYRIRWNDGHETIYTPASGALRAEQPPKRARKAPPRKR